MITSSNIVSECSSKYVAVLDHHWPCSQKWTAIWDPLGQLEVLYGFQCKCATRVSDRLIYRSARCEVVLYVLNLPARILYSTGNNYTSWVKYVRLVLLRIPIFVCSCTCVSLIFCVLNDAIGTQSDLDVSGRHNGGLNRWRHGASLGMWIWVFLVASLLVILSYTRPVSHRI